MWTTAAVAATIEDVQVIDAAGRIVTPGFVDTHRHGTVHRPRHRNERELTVRDGRAGGHEFADATATSPSTVERRLRRLRSTRALQVVVDVDRRALGLGARILLRMTVPAGELEATGRTFATHPEVAFAAATTGRTNLYASVLTRDSESFHTSLTTRVGAIRAVRNIECGLVYPRDQDDDGAAARSASLTSVLVPADIVRRSRLAVFPIGGRPGRSDAAAPPTSVHFAWSAGASRRNHDGHRCHTSSAGIGNSHRFMTPTLIFATRQQPVYRENRNINTCY